jgi:hypothetical protein
VAGLTVHAAERAVESTLASKAMFGSNTGSLPAAQKSSGSDLSVPQRGDSQLPPPMWCVGEDAIYGACSDIHGSGGLSVRR